MILGRMRSGPGIKVGNGGGLALKMGFFFESQISTMPFSLPATAPRTKMQFKALSIFNTFRDLQVT